MKKVLFALCFSISVLVSFGQLGTCEKVKLMVEVVNENHYSPRPIDAEFLGYAFDYFIETIDEHKLVFTKEDYSILNAYRLKLSEEILTEKCDFVDAKSDVVCAMRALKIMTNHQYINFKITS